MSQSYECEQCHATFVVPSNIEMPEDMVCDYCGGYLIPKG